MSKHTPTRFESIPVEGDETQSYLQCQAIIRNITRPTIHLGMMETEIAARIVKCVNLHDELVGVLQVITPMAANYLDLQMISSNKDKDILNAYAVLAKAKGDA